MRRKYILAMSFIIGLVGSRYYFGLISLEGKYIKLYGLICLIIAVLLGSSCLTYLPSKFSMRLALYSLLILIIVQCIPILYVKWYILDNQILKFVELMVPSSVAVVGIMTLIDLIVRMYKVALSSNRQFIKTNLKTFGRKKKIKAIKVKG